VVRERRRDVASQCTLAETLKAQLEHEIGGRELLELAIDEECSVASDAPRYVKVQPH